MLGVAAFNFRATSDKVIREDELALSLGLDPIEHIIRSDSIALVLDELYRDSQPDFVLKVQPVATRVTHLRPIDDTMGASDLCLFLLGESGLKLLHNCHVQPGGDIVKAATLNVLLRLCGSPPH